MPQIRTVDELVEHLKQERVRFMCVLSFDGAIRALDLLDGCDEAACPIVAATHYSRAYDNGEAADAAADELGLDEIVARKIMLAADNGPGHDPSIRAKLLTLVE